MKEVKSSDNTVYYDSELRKRVLESGIHRGSYQKKLLRGRQKWSGGDLRGEAGKWASKYQNSRHNLRERLKSLDNVKVTEIREKRYGKRILLVGRNQSELNDLKDTIETR